MREFYAGTLRSSSGQKVTKLSQAKAIAASYGSEGDKKGKKMKTSTAGYEKGYGAAKGALGGEDKPKQRKLHTHEVHVRRGHKGGYIARHEMHDADGNADHKQPEYPLADEAAMLAHVKEHMGGAPAVDPAAAAGAAPEVAAENGE